MTDDKDKLLDQLWYTWSKDGLDGMAVGYRVRAASEGLHNLQDLRYKRVDRFLRYELPQGSNTSEFEARIAPTSLSFVQNGYETLLIRKVFKGRDYAGRNSIYFAHLIAGLPPEFTARDAIRLWYCSKLWPDSDSEIASNETRLSKIGYSELLDYVRQSQTSFNFAQVSEQLKSLLLITLSNGMPSHVYATGQSIFTAALIYGLTHCLPMTMLKGLTFTTYESNITGMEAVILGTITWADLQGTTELSIQPAAPTGPVSNDIHAYVNAAVVSLLEGNHTAKLNKLIEEAERHDCATTDELIELFKHRFRFGPLTARQLESIVLYANNNIEDLLDPGVWQESAALLLDHPDYWEKKGNSVFKTVYNWLYPADNKPVLSQQARDALLAFVNALAEHALAKIREVVLQGSIPSHPVAVFAVVALGNDSIYHKMLTEFAQDKQMYAQITADPLWKFHFWLLQCAKRLQSPPTTQQMSPWLSIRSWEKLGQVLKLDLPAEWERIAMYGRLEHEISRAAVPIVKAHEAKFTALLQLLLQQGALPEKEKQEYTAMVVQLFKTIVEYDALDHSYPNRAGLLLALLNTVPKDPHVVEGLFSIVRFATPHQLVAEESESVLYGCRSEVIVACATSPSLTEYVREYLLSLSPRKFEHERAVTFLRQLHQINAEPSTALPEGIALLLDHWLLIGNFLTLELVEREALVTVKPALKYIVQAKRHEVLQHQTAQQEQVDKQIRHKFMFEIIPFLVKRIKTEYHLETILEVVGEFLANTRWELLRWMAAVAGQNYDPDTASLSNLTPYLLCGIQEYTRARQPQAALDEYLDSLYAQVSDNALRNVETAIMAGVWPELIAIEWKGWRDRRKTSWQASIPIVNKFMPQQQKPPTGTQESQKEQPVSPTPSFSVPQEQGALSRQLDSTVPPRTSSLTSVFSRRSSTKPAYVAIVHQFGIRITLREYQRMHSILPLALRYWSTILAETEKRDRRLSRSIAFEMDMMKFLFDELQRSQAGAASKILVDYLVDNVLIEHEITRLKEEGKVPAQFLDPEPSMSIRIRECQKFVESANYQALLADSTSAEERLKHVLGILIQRQLFMEYLSDQKKELRKWLDVERRKAKIEYMKDRL